MPAPPSRQAEAKLARLLVLVAGICTVVVVLAVPLGYFWLSYRAEQREGHVAARLHAAFVTQVIAQAQGDWRNEIAGLIEAELSPGELPEQRTLSDRDGAQLSASAPPVAWPVLTSRVALMGPTGPVGEVAVHRSLQPVLLRTAVVGGLGLALGLVIFLSLRAVRRRALSRATQAVRDEEALAREQIEQSLQVVFGQAIDGIVMVTQAGDVVSANPAAQRMLGRTAEQLVGQPLAQWIAPARDSAGALPVMHGQFEARAMRADGQSFPLDVTINEAGAGQGVNRIAMLRDITERKRHETRLAQLANYDTLTGLPNRSLFMNNLRQAMARAERHGRTMALMFLDLDRFKVINDSLGHHIGDQLLQRVAGLLASSVRQGDAVARRDGADDVYRLGGDEFTVVLEDLADDQAAATVANRVLAVLEQPLMIEGNLLHASTSIGIALFKPGDAADVEGLVKQADMAMYRAKEVARGTYQFFSTDLGSKALDRQKMETNLRGALERGEFSLHYQPKADLKSGCVVGVEALLRWSRPGQPAIGPDRFVPVLEEIGLIVPVGLWVLREACRQVAEWNRTSTQPVSVAVNISPRQFRQPELLEHIAAALRDAGLKANHLEIELTESMLVDDSESVLRILRGVTALGVRVAIDDFGTGHSSLSYLKRFNIDTLKIDRSFVRDTPGDREDSAIAIAVIALAHGLNLRVVAEGVETHEQAAFLSEHGCDIIQGYLLSRPLPPAEMRDWLAHHASALQPEMATVS
jgi:diguanylate cyclase (GGDEF)-like protein/PAS domain S-box-containing protein